MAGIGVETTDGKRQGQPFTFALMLLGSVREVLGHGSIFGISLFGEHYPDFLMFVLPPGAFIALGFIIAGVNIINQRRGRAAAAQASMAGCRPAAHTVQE